MLTVLRRAGAFLARTNRIWKNNLVTKESWKLSKLIKKETPIHQFEDLRNPPKNTLVKDPS